MPRNGTGTYTLPQSPFVAGTTISSTAVNSNFADIATALTNSLPRDGQAGMTGQFKLADGSATTPSITFTNETGTGFSRSATGTLAVDIQGVQIGTFTSAGWTGATLPPDLSAYMKLAGNQTTTGGFGITVVNLGVLTSLVPNPFLGNYQLGYNNGACTVHAPSVDCAIDLMIINQAGAGALTLGGYYANPANAGDLYSATAGWVYIISIRRMAGIPTYTIKSLQ